MGEDVLEADLLAAFNRLPQAQREMLLDYAAFLVERHGVDPASLKPAAIARPESESVIAALKRLRATYPMLDASKLLTESSELMSQHLTEGREAVEVIDEFEVLFARYYQRFIES